jgi:hypothetical protein
MLPAPAFRLFAGEIFPPFDGNVNELRCDLYAIAASPRHFGGNYSSARTDERIINDFPWTRVVFHWPLHTLNRLLCAVSSL